MPHVITSLFPHLYTVFTAEGVHSKHVRARACTVTYKCIDTPASRTSHSSWTPRRRTRRLSRSKHCIRSSRRPHSNYEIPVLDSVRKSMCASQREHDMPFAGGGSTAPQGCLTSCQLSLADAARDRARPFRPRGLWRCALHSPEALRLSRAA